MEHIKCTNCGFSNRVGELICQNCGFNLRGGASISTRAFDGAAAENAPNNPSPTVAPATPDNPPAVAPTIAPAELGTASLAPNETGTLSAVDAPAEASPIVQAALSAMNSGIFQDGWKLRIEVDGGKEPVILIPKQELILGRRDPATGAMPDVDLTPFAGYRMGVSRRHAAIRLGDAKTLDLWDLGSSNGTFLNGTRLVAYRPYRLHDGDKIKLGQMSMNAFFQPNNT